MNLVTFIKKFGFPLILLLICIAICIANFTPGTFLTGWDTLHPEFNFKIYWLRILNSVWQSHQGLGAVASQAHASEIPRILILEFLSLFLSLNKLRYSYAFLMILVGPLGTYYFLERVFLKDFGSFSRKLTAFAGGLFYILNLGILQHFYVPLEMFLTHYGFLPWILLSSTEFYESRNRKNYLIFLLFSFLIISQSHTPTLFYAFFGVLGLYFFVLLVKDLISLDFKNFRIKFVNAFIIMFSTLLLNAFWLLPNLYFIANHSKEISESKIHHLFSEEAFLQNQEFGQLKDIAILRNFLFNWGEYVGNNSFGDLMTVWTLHLNSPHILTLGYFYFFLIVTGALLAILRKNRYATSLLLVSLFALFFIINDNPPLGQLFRYLQVTYPVFNEALRFPFTKFSIFLIFCYSAFFSFALASFLEILKKLGKFVPVFGTLVVMCVIFSLFLYAKPMFYGYLISPTMRVTIPQRYFELFSFLDQQNNYGRVADLPIQTFWGWEYYNWDPNTQLGYQGAGFLWFGIKQPLLNREFDRWDILNEQYYREMSTSIYSENLTGVEKTLDKYKISWILLDKSIVSPGADHKALFYPQIEKLFSQSKDIALAKDFGNGLLLYKYTPLQPFSRIETLDSFVYSNDSIFKENDDPIYQQYGNYAQVGDKNYPFLGITNYTENLRDSAVSSDNSNIYISNPSAGVPSALDGNLDVQYTVSFERDSSGKSFIDLIPVQNELRYMLTRHINISDVKNAKFVAVINNALPIVLDEPLFTGLPTSYTFTTKLKDSINVAIYKLTKVTLNPTNGLSTLLERCSDSVGGSSYSILYGQSGFTLSAHDIVSCLTINLNSLFLGSSVPPIFVVNADVTAKGATANVCVFDQITGLCTNRPLVNGTTVAVLKNDKLESYYLRFLAYNLRGSNANLEGSVVFNNITFYTGEKVNNMDLSVAMPAWGVRQTFMMHDLTIKKDMSFSGDVLDMPSSPRVCDRLSPDLSNTLSTVSEVNDQFVRYESHGDSLCDSYQFPFANHNMGYILEIKSRNISGMPLRICLTNEYSKRCDLYVSLETNNDFKTAYYLIPPMGNGVGYTVNLSNLIFGKGISINDLEYMALSPVPYAWLRSIHKDVSASHGEKLLVLNEAFERGWMAFCGLKLCNAEHIMVNNWSNGWVFKDGNIPSNVKIYFLPQLLQYIGFMLFPIALFIVFRM